MSDFERYLREERPPYMSRYVLFQIAEHLHTCEKLLSDVLVMEDVNLGRTMRETIANALQEKIT